MRVFDLAGAADVAAEDAHGLFTNAGTLIFQDEGRRLVSFDGGEGPGDSGALDRRDAGSGSHDVMIGLSSLDGGDVKQFRLSILLDRLSRSVLASSPRSIGSRRATSLVATTGNLRASMSRSTVEKPTFARVDFALLGATR